MAIHYYTKIQNLKIYFKKMESDLRSSFIKRIFFFCQNIFIDIYRNKKYLMMLGDILSDYLHMKKKFY